MSNPSSDCLLRNDNGHFVDVTLQAGLLNQAWGLSASIGDFNNDGWQDIYVANDYIQPDQLYINQGDGTFQDEILTRMGHIAYNSMGSDYADIDNDLHADLMVLDMLARDHVRGKENMATMDVDGFRLLVESDYHHTYMANMMYVNNTDGTFKEVGQLAGISSTDWSWSPLIADFDNDGWKDIFVTNGISRDLSNQDYRQRLNNIVRSGRNMSIQQAEELMPATKLPNYVFRNLGDWRFEQSNAEWGLDLPVNSNGAAYADLDNDGDLELITNNQGDKAMIWQNNSRNNFIKVKLQSTEGVITTGARIKVYDRAKAQLRNSYRVRGYQSTVADVLHFGMGSETVVDSLVVELPKGERVVVIRPAINQTVEVDLSKARSFENRLRNRLFEKVDAHELGIGFVHREDNFDDFAIQTLLPHKQSVQGPAVGVGDLNTDGLQDLYFGGAAGQVGAVYLQQANGQFAKRTSPALLADRSFEDLGALFFDADGDKDLDLYVTSGGYQFCDQRTAMSDRLYLNDGKGRLQKSPFEMPVATATKAVVALDFDHDNDLDLFVGGTVSSCEYPLSSASYLLRNDGAGRFTDVTKEQAPDVSDLGIIHEVITTDYDNDGDLDLAIAGEWMPITFVENREGYFKILDVPALSRTSGWWYSVTPTDLNSDGLVDFIFGNMGENNKFHPTPDKPLHIYGGHFDQDKSFDMMLSKIYKGNLVPVRGKQCSTEQNPSLAKKISTYRGFATATMADIYGNEFLQNATHLKAETMSSVKVFNLGDGRFQVERMHSIAQVGPTKSSLVIDVN
ncbi:MAG: VCBS repeat-containing protein, partial [Bacteroidota bacterium]